MLLENEKNLGEDSPENLEFFRLRLIPCKSVRILYEFWKKQFIDDGPSMKRHAKLRDFLSLGWHHEDL